jgi:2-C-methyl-D-erythritol 4-phosphate cytidylyltransferase
MIPVSVILACGGKSERLGCDKQLYNLADVPVFIRALRNFDDINDIIEFIIAVPEEKISEYNNLTEHYGIKKPVTVVPGGETSTASVINAFREADKASRLIAVSDGARPFTAAEHITQCIKDTTVFGASVLGVPVKDTIKIADDGIITDTPDRRKLFAMQTPQIFRRDIFVKGVQFALDHELSFTDDAAMIEAVGAKVHITIADYRNIKITTPEDLALAKVFASASEK